MIDPAAILAVSEMRKLARMWDELKLFLTRGLVEFGQFKECHTGKWEEAYSALLAKMEELEKE